MRNKQREASAVATLKGWPRLCCTFLLLSSFPQRSAASNGFPDRGSIAPQISLWTEARVEHMCAGTMRDQVASLPAAALTGFEATMLAAAKLAAADSGGLKDHSKSESVGNSRFSSMDSSDTLLSPPSTSPPSTPGRSDDEALVSRCSRGGRLLTVRQS